MCVHLAFYGFSGVARLLLSRDNWHELVDGQELVFVVGRPGQERGDSDDVHIARD